LSNTFTWNDVVKRLCF